MVETKTSPRLTKGVPWNTNTLSFALVLILGSACGDDSKPSTDHDPQAEAGSGGDTPAAGSGARSAGTGGAGGTTGTPPKAGSDGNGRAGAGGSAGGSAADGGRDAPAAGRGGQSGGGAATAGRDGSAGHAGEPANDDVPSANEIAAQIAEAICAALEACVGAQKLAALNLREECGARFSASLAQDDFGTLPASIEAGLVTLDPSKLEACYRDTRALGCDVQTERLPASCGGAIAGEQAAGEACSIGAECENGSFCPIAAQCPRVCEPTRDEGGECTRDAECQRGTICNDGVCAAPALQGQACAGGSGATCKIGLSCVGSTDTQAGTCQANAKVQAAALGAVCTPGGTLCQEGLSCAFDSGSTFKCVGAVGSGATCKLSLPSQCPLDSYCDATDVTVTGTCRTLPTDGMPCVLGDDCAPGHVCVSQADVATCAKIGDLGDDCESDALCRSGFCEDGSCALRPRCE